MKQQQTSTGKIRVRYAPSPTGRLHLGGARTALFNYLFAKHNDGDFIVRIEDTDLKRNFIDGDRQQIDNLIWLGIIPDESPFHPGKFGPYRQTERLEIYQQYVDELLKNKLAYRCFCDEEELQAERDRQLKIGIKAPKYSGKCRLLSEKVINQKLANNEPFNIRFKTTKEQQKNYSWFDGVRDLVTFSAADLDDWIIQKSNKIPTYNFAVVIDDYLMKISHVFRGEEHISNTPKQLQIYEAFNWTPPHFAHLTVIIGNDGKKLSKRDETTMQFIDNYREVGFLPAAIINFLALLGWTPGSEEEIFSLQDLIKIFDEKRLSASPTHFNLEKLLWTNNYYFNKLTAKELFTVLNPFCQNIALSAAKKQQIFNVYQPQLRQGNEISELIKIFTDENLHFSSEQKSVIKANQNLYREFSNRLTNLEVWNHDEILNALTLTGKSLSLKGRNLMYPLRVILTANLIGPSLVAIVEIFEKTKTLDRLSKGI